MDALTRTGTKEADIHVLKVPGAFEIPLAAKKLAATDRYNAVICLGAVIRGATPHFDMIAAETTKGLSSIGRETGVPTVFGIVTADTLEQAAERSGSKMGNRGWDAAQAAVEMANLGEAFGGWPAPGEAAASPAAGTKKKAKRDGSKRTARR